MGVSRGQFIKLERGERGLTERTLKLASKAFEVSRATVLGDEAVAVEADAEPEREDASNARLDPANAPVDSAVFKGPRNVPVYGTGIGGEDGDFRLNGQIIDHAPRPPGIENRRDVYVVYVVGDSVAPKYEDGDPIYVDPHRRPAPRDYVFVEMWGASDGEPGQALIKRLVGRRGGKLYLEQHNPPKALEPIPEDAVKRVHRVIPWPELIGI